MYYPGVVRPLTVDEFAVWKVVEGSCTGIFQALHAPAGRFFKRNQGSQKPSVRLSTGFVTLEKVLAVQLLTGINTI